jgi:N6-L-threonylcarbamoyladenine synthase
MREWNSYEVIGQTRDDAVGEAFDKVARMLDLPYPGGPEISKLADLERTTKTSTVPYILPRPMIHSKDYDFSFSGIKTAVLYSLKAMTAPLTGNDKQMVAKEFEDAITEVLVAKTLKAIDEFGAMTVIVGGGVVSNTHVRQELEKALSRYSNVRLLLPDKELRTDNALMIGIAGYVNWLGKNTGNDLIALGNLSIDNTK